MYRTLLEGVWPRENDTLYIMYRHQYEHLTHTLQATCGTLLTNEYDHLTHTLQATCGTLLTNENEHPTHTLQATCGTLLTNENTHPLVRENAELPLRKISSSLDLFFQLIRQVWEEVEASNALHLVYAVDIT